jgi:hypothetical protein
MADPKVSAPVDSEPRCAWSESDDQFYEEGRCVTGKPALFYNCNECGPVCESHVCRCRPSLLAERAAAARRATIERCLAGLRKLGVPEIALAPVVAYLAGVDCQVSGIKTGSEARR